jgi:malonyl-CoA O-methyltransferase
MSGRDDAGGNAIERGEVRRAFGRAAVGYDAAAELQRRVRDELLSRLDYVTLEPAAVLDLGTGTGHAALALKRRYPASMVVALDLAESMLAEARRRQSLFRRFHRVCADAAALPLRSGTVDLVYSNLMLQWCDVPDGVFAECRRVLRAGGLLSFTTFGPDTLVELRRAWAEADDGGVHVSRFLDMHDVGDALVRSGFAEPVMDVDRVTLTYAEVRDLMRDLKAIGAHNAASGRRRGLTGKSTFARMVEAYERERRDGRLPATYEVVYGHAWAPATSGRRADPPGVVRVPVGRIGRRQPGSGGPSSA